MEKLKNYAAVHPVLFGGLLFGALSLMLNVFWIVVFQMAHVNDIVHVFPAILIVSAFLPMMGGFVSSQFVFVPIAVIMDLLVGLLVGWVAGKVWRTPKAYFLGLALSFGVYWIVITYQWIPMFG